MNSTIPNQINHDQNSQSFFMELLKKDDVRAVGGVFKNIYDIIQQRKQFIPGESLNASKRLADLKAKTASLHNWFLYNYGSGSLADHHLEIVKKVVDGNMEDLKTIENIIHVSNRSRGIREVDEFISTILNGKQESYHSEKIPVKVGDIKGVNFSINKNRVDQNNLTDPENPLMVIQRGVQMIPVANPRQLTMVEQMNGAENMIMNVLTPDKTFKTERQTIDVRTLN